jgi:DNA integrity scanning protein DisA with diadenylate cyclase activity
MNKIEIENLISILVFIVLPVITGYIASKRGRNPIAWGLLTFFSCGICAIIIFFLPKKKMNEFGLYNKKMDENTRRQIQMDMDRVQLKSIQQMNNVNQINDFNHMN